jgi:hypothetical protein
MRLVQDGEQVHGPRAAIPGAAHKVASRARAHHVRRLTPALPRAGLNFSTAEAKRALRTFVSSSRRRPRSRGRVFATRRRASEGLPSLRRVARLDWRTCRSRSQPQAEASSYTRVRSVSNTTKLSVRYAAHLVLACQHGVTSKYT